MKKILFTFLLVASICLKAQTTFWTEGFGTGCNQLQAANGLNPGGNGTWTVSILGAEDPQANTWFISATENGNAVGACGTGCGTNQTLHVASIPNSSGLTFCASGDCGASYDAGGTSAFGGTSTGTNKRVESPVINCTGHSTITLAFKYMENGQGAADDASLWYFDGTTWANINALAKTTLCGGQGKWTAFTLTLPASADNNPNVKIGFLWVNDDDGAGTDPSFAVDDVTLTDAATTSNPVVTITPLPSATVCITSTLTLNGFATNGPITSYSWTVTPPIGATFIPNATTPTVSVTFSVQGTYTFNLTATNASGTGNTTQIITVTPLAVSSVNIAANPSNPVCPGTVISFTALPTNAGTNPNYQWQVNGTNAGTNAQTFTPALASNNNDVISVTLTPTASCTSPSNASYTVQVSALITPTITILAFPSGTVCPGTIITFSANNSGAGANPAYQWQVNGVNAGTNASTFVAPILLNNDVVTVTVTPAVSCATTGAASYTVHVSATITPSVSITVSPSATVCTGSIITFSATPSNGGATPIFQWIKNGINSGTNSPTYTLIPANGDQVYVLLTSSALCALPLTVSSNTIIITVGAGTPITTGTTSTICTGDSTTLSSTGTNWVWTPATNLSCTNCQHPIASPTVTTIYTVTATSGACTSTATQTVIVNPSATAIFATSGAVIGVPQTINFINGSLNSTGYLWDFGDNSGTIVVTNPSHTYNTVGIYTVTLIAYGANSCNNTTTLTIIVADTAGLSMPNIFTPNGDGVNDVFQPNAHGLTSLTCTIYDRWGIKITDLDTSAQQYWDGHTTSGIACSDGTYFYILKATDVNGKTYSLKGFIQLIR